MPRRVWQYLLLSILLISTAAQADTVTLTLQSVNPPGNNDGRYYVYPYNFSVNNSSTLTPLLCDDFVDEVTVGQSWIANVSKISDLQGFLDPRGTTNPTDEQRLLAYQQAAWLFNQLGPAPANNLAVAINYAIWGLFSDAAYNSTSYQQFGSSAWAAAAYTAVTDTAHPLPAGYFDDFRIYTPIDPTTGQNLVSGAPGTPQEYIGLVPEPATLVLLVPGLLAVFLRRKP